jgi:DNA polymerase-1
VHYHCSHAGCKKAGNSCWAALARLWELDQERAAARAAESKDKGKAATAGATTETGKRAAGQPRVREIPPYLPFPTGALPEPVGKFVRECAAALVVDPALIALPALSAAAAAIGATRTIRLKRGWCEPCIIWSAVVGESGTLKTPAYRHAVNFLFERDDHLAAEFKIAEEEYRRETAEYRRKVKDDTAADERGDPPTPPVQRRVAGIDMTIESLAEILEDNPRGLLVARDELAAWLGSFSRYRDKGGTDLYHWNSIFNAGPLALDRRTGPRKHVRVPRAVVSIAGGVQPGVLRRVLTPEFLESGLIARLVLAMPPKAIKTWSTVEVHPDTEKAYHGALEKLLALEFATRGGEKVPHALRLSPDGQDAWIRFYTEWAHEQFAAEGELASALSKLEGYAARFALLHHVVSHIGLDSDDTAHPIGVRSVEAGVILCRWFADEARRVYTILSESEDECAARRLVELIRARGGRVTVRALQRANNRKYPDAGLATAALEALAGAGLGSWTREDPGPKGGKPVAWFVLNPCTTHDITDVTPDGDDDGDDEAGGQGARQNPPPHDITPQNSREIQGNVSNVMRRAEVPSAPNGPSAGVPEAGGVLSCTPGVMSCSPAPDGRSVAAGPFTTSSSGLLVTDPAALPAVIQAVHESPLVGVDCETTGLDPRSDRVRLLTLTCDTTDGGTVTYVVDCFAVDPAPLWPALAAVPIVGHNLSFDLQFLARHGFEPGECRDTMLMSQVLYAGERGLRHRLADCCERELGEAVSKELQASDWSGILSADQLAYAARDALLTRRLHDVLAPKLAEADLTGTATLENRTLPAVAWMAGAGVAFDRDGWLALAGEARSEADRLEALLNALAPERYDETSTRPVGWNWSSPKQVMEALAELGVGVVNTTDEVLAEVGHPVAGLLRGYRAAKKLATTYGEGWLRTGYSDGRVHAQWGQAFACSGRMSCSRPNLQQLPRDPRYRGCVVAPAGRVLVKADYNQIELRIAAKVADERNMLEAYRRGDDLHTLTARRVLGREEVSPADRQIAKSLNFGLLFGMGAARLRQYARSNFGVDLTDEQAVGYRAEFFKAYPWLSRWHARAGRSRGESVATRTLGGRRRLAVDRFTEKLNTPVQGTGADGLKAALALLWERRAECPGAVPVLAVHDEVAVECDADRADAVAAWLKRAMLDGMEPLVAPVPVEVEVTTALTWGG